MDYYKRKRRSHAAVKDEKRIRTREDKTSAMTTESASFSSYEQYQPYFSGHDQLSDSQNHSNLYLPDYALGGYYNPWEPTTSSSTALNELNISPTQAFDSMWPYNYNNYDACTMSTVAYPCLPWMQTYDQLPSENEVSNVDNESQKSSCIYDDNSQQKTIPCWIRDELKKIVSKNQQKLNTTINEQNNYNFTNENSYHNINCETESTITKLETNNQSIVPKYMMKLKQHQIMSKIFMDCTKNMMLNIVKKVLMTATPKESHVIDTRDNQVKISLIDQLGLRTYCSESDSSDENDEEHRATKPSHGFTLQDPDKVTQETIANKHAKFCKTETEIEWEVDKSGKWMKKYNHRDTFNVNRKKRSDSRSKTTSYSRFQRNRPYSKQRNGMHSKYYKKSDDHKSRSRYRRHPISS